MFCVFVSKDDRHYKGKNISIYTHVFTGEFAGSRPCFIVYELNMQ